MAVSLEEIHKALLDGGVKSKDALAHAQTLFASPHSHLWNAADLKAHAEGMIAGAASTWGESRRDAHVKGSVAKLAREGITDAHAAKFTDAACGGTTGAGHRVLTAVRTANGELADGYKALAAKTVELAEAQASGWKGRISKATGALETAKHNITDLVFKANKAASASKGIMPSVAVDSMIQASVNHAGLAPVSWATRMIASSTGIEEMRHGAAFKLSHISFGKAIGWTALAALIGAGSTNLLGNDAADTQRR